MLVEVPHYCYRLSLMQLALVTGCLLLNVHQWSDKNLVPMCAKVISISCTCGLLTIIRKRLQGKKFTSSIHFNHYLWITGKFQKYQTKVANFCPSFGWSNGRMLKPPDPLTPLGALPPDSRYRLALRTRHESYSRLLSTPLFSTWRRPWMQAQLSSVLSQCTRLTDGRTGGLIFLSLHRVCRPIPCSAVKIRWSVRSVKVSVLRLVL